MTTLQKVGLAIAFSGLLPTSYAAAGKWTGLYQGEAQRAKLEQVYIVTEDGRKLPFPEVFNGFQPDTGFLVKRFPVDEIHLTDILNREIAAVLEVYDANGNRMIEEPEFAVFYLIEGARGLGYAANHVEIGARADALLLPASDTGGLMNYVYGRISAMKEPARTRLDEVKWIGYHERLKPSEGNGDNAIEAR